MIKIKTAKLKRTLKIKNHKNNDKCNLEETMVKNNKKLKMIAIVVMIMISTTIVPFQNKKKTKKEKH